MNVKNKVKKGYDQAAELWHKSRLATPKNTKDERLLKQNRPHLFVEKPGMMSHLPNLKGKDILCIGCGWGEECIELSKLKPKNITGIDISKNLITIAKRESPKFSFYQMDAEKLKFKNGSFDFVYCSLVLDYFKSWDKVFAEVLRVLRKDGIFLFSNIHPVKWSAETIDDDGGKASRTLLGFDRSVKEGKVKIYGDYLNVRVHPKIWMDKFKVSFYTKPISLMISEILESGFKIKGVWEPKAVKETKEYDKDYWAINQKIPNFIIFKLEK